VPFAVVHNAHRTSDDPLVMIAGGPGGRVIPRRIRPVSPEFGGRDVVFFEQRGTDLADPRLDCPGYAEEKQKAQLGRIDGRELARGLIEVARRCVADAGRKGIRLSGYTSRAIVGDLEDFRRLQGYSRINLVGVSYGGKVIFEYARDHPDHTRAVVANTPLTLEANYDEQGQSAMRRTLDLIIAGCEREPACDDAHPRLDRKFRDIVERVGVPRLLFSDFPLGNAAGRPKDAVSQAFTLELALRTLEAAPGSRTTVQSPLRWSSNPDWKLDYCNIERLGPDEIRRRREEFDRAKLQAKQLRDGIDLASRGEEQRR